MQNINTPFREALTTVNEVTEIVSLNEQLLMSYVQTERKFLSIGVPELNIPHLSELFSVMTLLEQLRISELPTFQMKRMVPCPFSPVATIDKIEKSTKLVEILEILLSIEQELYNVSFH